MKYLFENIQTVDELLNAGEKTILLTDFDGTLTPIQKHPPVEWNKASTIQWLLSHYFPEEFSEDALLIYLGDDKADIEVFDSLRRKGLTIFVGNPLDTSAAEYYVYSPEEVKVFLEHLLRTKARGR